MHTLTDNLLDQISAAPRLWNGLRWLAEAGYGGERLAIARELRPWAGDQRRFLDLGCGTGAFASEFPPERYVGADPARGYLRFAGRHRPGRYLVSTGQQLALADTSFDAALICGVLHHLADGSAQALMGELARVLRPEATVLVMEDIPPPSGTNPAGHLMHQLDRGGYIRSDADYLALFGGWFQVIDHYQIRSGICDYAVYVLSRLP
ncbi:class I SAM-dependent methyltransferase [Candidatus Viridilinea mediisalina]|uniref:Methyltransferase type 11 n=1 Tax=Candidatus Viridilinea mediisalina TaxID=2024553 RepID=A0A2A6RMI6_9CHLR|nr:class I SAM-dependent methyltransferase [Candidatus Viridilinea mediisalina]PDW04098.1 methyltransferase type 11 [Candidatus Viridilinea mediisalina]